MAHLGPLDESYVNPFQPRSILASAEPASTGAASIFAEFAGSGLIDELPPLVEAPPHHRRTAPITEMSAALFGGMYDGPAHRAPTGTVLPAEMLATDPAGGPLSHGDVNDAMSNLRSAAQVTRAYHATRTEHLGGETGILEQGLQPRFGGSGAAASSAAFAAQSVGKVHYTPSLSSATDYERFFETGSGFSGRTTRSSPAEVLNLSLPRPLVTAAARDPDDNAARTLTQAIPAENIQRTSPAALPPLGQQLDWQAHQARGDAETEALFSNVDAQTREMVMRYPPSERGTVMQMLKQGVKSMPHLTQAPRRAF